MRFWLRTLFIVLFGLVSVAAEAADIKPFVRDYLASDAVHLAETLKGEAAKSGALTQGKSAEQLRRDLGGAIGKSDSKLAEKLSAGAGGENPKDAANWLALARLAISADDATFSDRYFLRERGSTAAYAAFERVGTPPLQAEA